MGKKDKTAEGFDEAIEMLKVMKDKAEVDEADLEALAAKVDGLSEEAKHAFIAMPLIQQLIENVAEKAIDKEPGRVIRIGGGDMAFSYKVPYSIEDVYKKWPLVDEFIADQDYTVVVPGGWVFKLRQDMVYDTPKGEECAEGHGYKLPGIVVSIIRDSKRTLAENRRNNEQRPFGMGVRFLQVGWAGKEDAINTGPKHGEGE